MAHFSANRLTANLDYAMPNALERRLTTGTTLEHKF